MLFVRLGKIDCKGLSRNTKSLALRENESGASNRLLSLISIYATQFVTTQVISTLSSKQFGTVRP